ncbi:MAG: hypothetical protein NTU47_18150 [Ignavibacteriales bacterium]|nr:hypothetical protein [Ignavibacteriales bacterium]
MNLNSFLLEQALKKLNLSEESLSQFRLVSAAGDVDGTGFPRELFELSAPMLIRGLLNFSVLQMNRSWIYPYWVHRQLEPGSASFIPRSQNPLLINITHRDWTALGSPTGFHEAIIDPRGLVTPLPREWSIDVWLVENGEIFFPSLSSSVDQQLDTDAPRITTAFTWRGLRLQTEAFVGCVRGGKDIMFCRATVLNQSSVPRHMQVGVAIRPFGVEGVAPIKKIDFESPRVASVDGIVGMVFAQEPRAVVFGSASLGDAARSIKSEQTAEHRDTIACAKGLANAVALFDLTLSPSAEQSICYSMALGTRAELKASPIKRTWRVSFEKRRGEQQAAWAKELEGSAAIDFGDDSLQELFEASRNALLQFQDGDFISPGPYLYHHFWFRDAAPMLKALDVLGFPKRVRQVIDGFPTRLMSDGFFRAPGGEWDSNGAVLWTVYEHYRFTRSLLWLKELYPALAKAGRWIIRMRRKTGNTGSTHKRLMPESLSAEHLGTVDQYYWDSFWSLAGLKALSEIARELRHESAATLFETEASEFESDLLESFRSVEQRLGVPLIPSTPSRPFDESAIGSVSSIYPLSLFEPTIPHPRETLKAIVERFIDERGFYHPIIHSGYNAYLTLQVAHSLLNQGESDDAWRIAASIFRQATASYTFPEAIHPKTEGGAMGDGHHGWAAAEVVLFLRDCLLREQEGRLEFFAGAAPHLMKKGRNLRITDAPTGFGKISLALEFQTDNSFNLSFASRFLPKSSPSSIDVLLPWRARKISPSSPHHLIASENLPRGMKIRFSPHVSTALIQLEA